MRGLLCTRLCVLEAGDVKTDETCSCPCESLRETQTHVGASTQVAFKAGNCCTEGGGITSTQDWGKQGSLHGGGRFFFFLTSLLEYNCYTMVC